MHKRCPESDPIHVLFGAKHSCHSICLIRRSYAIDRSLEPNQRRLAHGIAKGVRNRQGGQT